MFLPFTITGILVLGLAVFGLATHRGRLAKVALAVGMLAMIAPLFIFFIIPC
ncbi:MULTISPECIES: hypothetical protein [Lacticaseibacillus]|uniref:hypothetical protein n=1 Tax=Lacticaseibacillus TaxID=2759736 RepID=UPI001CD24D84|nr:MULTISPECIES: hypothetical protein [Lacticaseibacillus]